MTYFTVGHIFGLPEPRAGTVCGETIVPMLGGETNSCERVSSGPESPTIVPAVA